MSRNNIRANGEKIKAEQKKKGRCDRCRIKGSNAHESLQRHTKGKITEGTPKIFVKWGSMKKKKHDRLGFEEKRKGTKGSDEQTPVPTTRGDDPHTRQKYLKPRQRKTTREQHRCMDRGQ